MAPVTRGVVLIVLAALAGCGHSSGPTDAFSDPASIPRPTGLTAQQTEIGAFLIWTAPDSDFVVIAGWHVYRKTPGGAFTRLTIDPVVDRQFSDRNVLDIGFTEYRVTAISRGGVESLPTAPVSVFVDTDEPSRPEGIAAVALTSSIFVSWTTGPENDLKGYDVYRDGLLVAMVGDPDMPAFLDFDVLAGREYAYYVLAVDFQNHRSAPSDTVRAALPVPQSE